MNRCVLARRSLAAAGAAALASVGLVTMPPAQASTASQLAPAFIETTQVAPHTVRLTIDPPAHSKGLVGYQIYRRNGAKAPQSLDTHKPSGKPDKVYTGGIKHPAHVKMHGLKTLAPYNFVVYGYDKHGRFAGTRSSVVVLVNDGMHLAGDSLDFKHATAGDLTIDKTGRRHAIALVKPSQRSRSENLRVAYATRAPGAKHWKTTTPKATIEASGGLVSLEPSTDGKKVAVLMNVCSGIYTQQTAASARSMPTLNRTMKSDNCSATDDDALVARGWVQVPHGKAIIAANGEGGDAQVLTGTPGGSFTSTLLPGGADYGVRDITRDPNTGEVVVAGSNGSGTVVWSLKGGTWSDPTPVSTMTADGSVESITAHAGRVYLGFGGNTVESKKRGFTETLFLTTRNKAGVWSSRTKLPHTTRHDDGLLLYANPDTGHLHAAWTRYKQSCQLTCGGLYQEAKVGKSWNQAKRLTHWYRDEAVGIAVTKSDHTIVGYLRS